MRLTKFLILTCLPLLIAAGCSKPIAPADPMLAFCDAAEPRRFSQAEIDWRSANAATNLRKDFKDNTTGERECGWFG